MKINLKCFADLAQRYACDYRAATTLDLNKGSTVDALMRASGIARDEVRIVFVNGRISGAQQTLNDGDRVTLVPATGGM